MFYQDTFPSYLRTDRFTSIEFLQFSIHHFLIDLKSFFRTAMKRDKEIFVFLKVGFPDMNVLISV